MKRLLIICEGETEQEFCKAVLHQYFIEKKIIIQCPAIKKTGGGIAKWPVIHDQILNHLKQEPSLFVTTFIDFYGIRPKHAFPGWDSLIEGMSAELKINLLEKSMLASIPENFRSRFIPYLQMREFEALLLSDFSVFEALMSLPILQRCASLSILIQTPNG
ncbi:MAG TPA: DUF4276 family protein [Saprospiraceae bacterium]|nr:DUF4276 family protein [Saprospiraceae bacterium]HMQ81758.1 DUF4276 family protein [Saprospiraceae bacterium]